MHAMALQEAQARPYPLMPKELAGSAIIEAYCRKTPTSAKLAERARRVFPSGITHDVRYIEPYGIYVTRAQAMRKWDVDGNEYVDYPGGHGALLLGHNHPTVLAAVQEQLPKGTHYGACHELEVRWGELIQQMVPCAERVRLTNSGTEATLLAIRLARAYSGKPKILRFLGHFHGWHDHASFGFSSHFDGSPTPGVLAEIAQNVVLAPPWDIAETRRIVEAHDDIAGAIIEPTGSTWGQVPVTQSFLQSLRELTAQRGIVLIFDEVISGFRCAPGGIQEAWGIVPELAALGKIVAGGMHGGALAGRQDILDLMDFRVAAAVGREKVFHQGTYNAMPTSCAAAVAALEIIRTTDACQRAMAYGRSLQDALNRVFAEEGVNWISYGTFGGFHVFLNPNGLRTTRDEIESGKFDHATLRAPVRPSLAMKLRVGLLLHGVDIQPWPGAPVSAAHTDRDLEQTAEAFRKTIRMLRAEKEVE
jgi:glutamate-1-semialdehyde 2,1-aminomutase